MFVRIVGALAFLASLFVPAFAGPETGCDLEKVVGGFRCEVDGRLLLEKELASEVEHWACPECGETRRAAGNCEWCEKELEKRTSGKGVCPDCLKKPTAVELCLKTYRECPDCGATLRKAARCEGCDVATVEKSSRALVRYVCEKCSATSLVPAKCGDEECEEFGRPMRRECSESGRFPHSRD